MLANISTAFNWPDAAKLLFSATSLIVTVYFWFVRVNREKPDLAVFVAGGFEGSLESGGIGAWAGKLFLANRSIMPTAVVAADVELYWKGRWVKGYCNISRDNDLPWNMPPTQVYPKDVTAAFELGADTPLDRIYAPQQLRFTFTTIEGRRVTTEISTTMESSAAA